MKRALRRPFSFAFRDTEPRSSIAAPPGVKSGADLELTPMRFLRLVLIAVLGSPFLAAAQPAVGPHRQMYMYQGADRDQRILAAAHEENQVTVYTSLHLTEQVPITQAFEKKYGVKVELWRSSSEKVLQRALTE